MTRAPVFSSPHRRLVQANDTPTVTCTPDVRWIRSCALCATAAGGPAHPTMKRHGTLGPVPAASSRQARALNVRIPPHATIKLAYLRGAATALRASWRRRRQEPTARSTWAGPSRSVLAGKRDYPCNAARLRPASGLQAGVEAAPRSLSDSHVLPACAPSPPLLECQPFRRKPRLPNAHSRHEADHRTTAPRLCCDRGTRWHAEPVAEGYVHRARRSDHCVRRYTVAGNHAEFAVKSAHRGQFRRSVRAQRLSVSGRSQHQPTWERRVRGPAQSIQHALILALPGDRGDYSKAGAAADFAGLR